MTQYNSKIEELIEDLSSMYQQFKETRPSTTDILGRKSISHNQRGLVESAKIIVDNYETTLKPKYRDESENSQLVKTVLEDLETLSNEVRENTQPVSYSGLHNLLKSGSPHSSNPNHNPFEDIVYKAKNYSK